MENFKKMWVILILGIISIFEVKSQCDTVAIDKALWSIHYVDSEELTGEGANNGHALQAIDGDVSNFWHTEWDAAQIPYPHEIQINLGASHSVNGLSVLSRYNSSPGKPKGYEVYLSQDGVTWSQLQSAGDLQYPDITLSNQRANVYFGAISAQYVKLVFLSCYSNDYYSVVSEIDVFEDTSCLPSALSNQIISFSELAKKGTTDLPFILGANSNSGLPITYEIVSGPATLNGNILSLTGQVGVVSVKAIQTGNGLFYPSEFVRSFDVLDLSTFYPVLQTKLTDFFSLQMGELSPYLLYAAASIPEPELLSVQSVKYEIDGTTYFAEFIDNSYQALWTPSSFGMHTVYAIVTGSNGNQEIDTLNIEVTSTVSDNLVVSTFDDGVIDFGTLGSQWYYGTYKLPQSVGVYDTIWANFSIGCPNVPGGCDDWDRLAWVEFKAPNGKWYELFRYITPYGVACSQSIDVTDFASLLQGNIEFRMFIETWGSGGWKLNLDFDYNKGAPLYKYTTIQELWHGDYSFGNLTNLQPLDTITAHFIENNTLASKMRLTSTGHGWGANNTGNAAEFYHAYHDVQVNHANTFVQDLWQDCNPNPASCTGQQGTWQYDRAGWCPGSMGKIFSYNLTPYIANDSIDLNYKFQNSYTDLCQPSNPNCVSGVTCDDCNAGYNPYYRVSSYVINSSNQLKIENSHAQVEVLKDDNFGFQLYPNPSSNVFQVALKDDYKNIVFSINDVSGKVLKTYFFNSKSELNKHMFNVESLPKGIYFVKIQADGSFSTSKLILN